MRQQLIQLLLAAIVVLGPVLNWLYHTLKKQKARRDAELQRERRELEQLRTGRPVAEPAIPPEELRRQREVNTRREAELAELRRRMAGQTPTEGILIQIPGTSGPIVVQRVPRQAPAPAGSGPQRQGRPQRSKRSGKPARSAPAAAPKAAPARRALQPAVEAEETRRLTTDSTADTPAAPESWMGTENWTPADWRRAVLIREVLGTPLGLRAPEDGPA